MSTIDDAVLMLDPIASLPLGSQLTFWHLMNSEAGFDGGVLEYSTDGNSWIDTVVIRKPTPFWIVSAVPTYSRGA